MDNEKFIAEGGKRFTSKNYEYVSEKAEVEPGVVYEMCFSIRKIFPWQSWNVLIAKIEGWVYKKIQEIKGITVIWWGLTKEEYHIEFKKKEEDTEGTHILIVTIATIAAAVSLAFAAGCFIVLAYSWTKKLLPPSKPLPWWSGPTVLAGGLLLLLLFTKSSEKKSG